MTKKHIWAKLLIVALIVAMISAFFIGCDPKDDDNDKKPCTSHVDANGDGKCDNCGATMEEPEEVDTASVEALINVLNDAVEKVTIDNVGNIGADAYIELAMVQGDKTDKVRIDLDLSLDLLKEAQSVYTNNGFGFTVSVNDKREFGLWYVDGGSEDSEGNPVDNYFYLTVGGQNLKIDALTVASVLAKYSVNADVNVGEKLEGFSLADWAAEQGLAEMIAGFVTINHETQGNKEVFSLNIRELFNPEGMLYGVVDAVLFGEDAALGFDLSSVLADFNINLTSSAALYDILPDVNLQVIGNYDANKAFESIALGLAIGEKADGITIPTVDGKGYTIVESVPATDLSATLGYKFFSDNYDAYDNVLAGQEAAIAEVGAENWNEIGLLNFALEGQVTLGKTKETAKTYNVQVSADINLAAVAEATFVKTVYYKNSAGEYYTEDGKVKSTDWFYLSGAGYFADYKSEKDVIDALLPAINSLYVKMVNTKNPEDILLINLDEKITTNAGGDFESGKMTINLAAVTGILETFGVKLDSTISNMISGIEGDNLPIRDILGAIKPVLAGFIYKGAPDGYEPTVVAPAAAASDLIMAEGETAEKPSILDTIMDVIKKVQKCVKIDSENLTVTAEGSGTDYTIDKAALDFKLSAALTKGADDAVNGVKVNVEKFVSNYNNNEVVTSVTGNVQIGDGEIFKAEVSVDQNKAGADAFDIFVGLTINKIGYGCATRTPVVLDGDKNPTSSIFTEVGWYAEKK